MSKIVSPEINIPFETEWTKNYEVAVTKTRNSQDIVRNQNIKRHASDAKTLVFRGCFNGRTFAIENKGNYLSIRYYQTSNLFNSGEFIQNYNFETMDKSIAKLQNYTSYIGAADNSTLKVEEFRVYKNKTVAKVAYIEFAEGSSEPNGYYINYSWHDAGTRTQVFTDRDLEKAAKKPTMKNTYDRLGFENFNGYDLRDIRNRIFESYYCSLPYLALNEKTTEILQDFFGIYATKLYEFCNFIGAPKVPAKDPMETKRDKALELSQYIQHNYPETWLVLEDRDSSNHVYTDHAYWTRYGDEILLWQHNKNRNASSMSIFSYNTKTKRRFFARSRYTNEWETPIPNLNIIMSEFNLNCKVQVRYMSRGWTANGGWSQGEKYNEYYNTEHYIMGGYSIEELFKGSNVEVVLKHPDACTLIGRRWSYDRESREIRNLINEHYISSVVFTIIFTTGEPMLEQMLKSNLLNLYFKTLEQRNQNPTGNFTPWIEYQDRYEKSRQYWRREYIQLIVKKGKNLKEMTGLTMNQLRILDSMSDIKSKIKSDSGGDGDEVSYWRPGYYLAGADQVYGINFSSLDEKTFRNLLTFSRVWDYNDHDDRDRRDNFLSQSYLSFMSERSETRDILLEKIHGVQSMQVKMKLAGILLTVDSSTLRDYLRMRVKLQALQLQHPETAGIWDETKYPLVPESCCKFVAYTPGSQDRITRQYDDYGLCEYRSYGKVEIVYSDNSTWAIDFDETHYPMLGENPGNYQIFSYILASKPQGVTVIGALVHMDPKGCLKYLHDEASYWVNLYQDEANAVLFDQAMNRVRPLEWKDEKSGLEIIAPTKIDDIKNEGAVLSHCVASYVSSILDGVENIMFLRRSDMIDRPFYTVEVLNDGQIRQVHCYRNGDLTEQGQENAHANSGLEVYNKTFDIIGFLLKWAKAKPTLKSSTIKATYGAYCAIH